MTVYRFPAITVLTALATCAPSAIGQPRTIKARVAAFDQVITYNRIGTQQLSGMMYALLRDIVPTQSSGLPTNISCAEQQCTPGQVQLRASKRPRPIVLRMNVGDTLEVEFTNLLTPTRPLDPSKVSDAFTTTRNAGFHVSGLNLVKTIESDASFVGANNSSLAPSPNSPGPGKATYFYRAEKPGGNLINSPAAMLGGTGAGQNSAGLFGAVNVEPQGAIWYRSQVTEAELRKVTTGHTKLDQPIINNYEAVYAAGETWADGTRIAPNTPVLAMLNSDNEIVYTDLTAIIAGSKAGPFPNHGEPEFLPNPASPHRNWPWREFTIIYHSDFNANQPFPEMSPGLTCSPMPQCQTLAIASQAGGDNFGINYGIAGIAAEILANRFGVGPEGKCSECKYEEFFLSSWSVGDPAMLVDYPANTQPKNPPQGCNAQGRGIMDFNPPVAGKGDPGKNPFSYEACFKATKAYFPDDPSNVYHSYLNDHVKFQILSADSDLHHIHHQHAHQWLHTPNSDESTYLDSQAIGPGSAFTLEITYGGSGNRNLTPGDSIFHCHFYPHFAQGMWSLWRVHDVFEAGTKLQADGTPTADSRALPDGEINAGTPIPAIVPIPSMPMAIMPSPVHIANGQVVFGANDHDGSTVKQNPGYPFFVPGVPGQRSVEPPMDFAITAGNEMNGGLPRHQTFTGTVTQFQTPYNFTKDTHTLTAKALDENGNNVEKVAMAYQQVGSHPSFTSSGAPGTYRTNGLPSQQGAPFADPCQKDNFEPESKILYKAADFQVDTIFNKKGWHNPQQRMLGLWGDVAPTMFGDATGAKKAPEPFFFRANSNGCIEYWQTNLVPNYYELDNFQVRTPTDILGQHIHLVKFDVLASDGATNGFNYEDGTLAPEEVQERVNAINANGGLQTTGGPQILPLVAPVFFCDKVNGALADHPELFDKYCNTDKTKGPIGLWVGAQTTIQRWWADPLLNNPIAGKQTDRTLRTVFTHDHFGPSTHQQAGLYAGLLVEPNGSTWTMPDPNDPSKTITMGERGKSLPGPADGGPTSWQANILAGVDSFREFALEFEDEQIGFLATSKAIPGGSPGACPNPTTCDLTKFGWYDNQKKVVNPPLLFGSNLTTPQIVSESFDLGTYTINYRNEPLPFRAWDPTNGVQAAGNAGDLSHVYASIPRADTALNCQPDQTFALGYAGGVNCIKKGNDKRMYPKLLQTGAGLTDPYTPLLRAYQNDKVQIRILVGSHLAPHDFSLQGLKWLAEPSYADSGYRGNQIMGISEHFELLFKLPPTNGNADYLYQANGSYLGQQHGIWGLLRAYDGKGGKQPGLDFLPNNPTGSGPALPPGYCPAGSNDVSFEVHALTADQLPGKQVTFNSRLGLLNPNALVYVEKSLLADVKAGTVPLEPLVLRVSSGDCVHVKVVNDFKPAAGKFPGPQPAFGVLGPPGQVWGDIPIFNYNISLSPSQQVGLHPQLLAYDVTKSNGFNIGLNPDQTTCVTPTPQCPNAMDYTWYAGDLFNPITGEFKPHPVEYGATNLVASDSLYQGSNGLIGALIVEPPGMKFQPDVTSQVSGLVMTPSGNFREGVIITQDLAFQRYKNNSGNTSPFPGNTAVNYGSEPWDLRIGNQIGRRGMQEFDQTCGLSNRFVTTALAPQATPASAVGELLTPIFTANAGAPTRLRVLNNGGLNDLVFELHGHSWQELPYRQGSTEIGNNPLSQWQGARMGHGTNNHFDVVLASAGGKDEIAGDYLYRSHPALGFRYGIWGVFRVAQKGKDAVSITANVLNKQLTLIGFNTVNPATGKLAASVQVFADGTSNGATCSGPNPPVTVTVNQLSGGWILKLPVGTKTVCVQSALGGIDSLVFPLPGNVVMPNGSFKNACTSANPGAPAGTQMTKQLHIQSTVKSFEMTKVVSREQAVIARQTVKPATAATKPK